MCRLKDQAGAFGFLKTLLLWVVAANLSIFVLSSSLYAQIPLFELSKKSTPKYDKFLNSSLSEHKYKEYEIEAYWQVTRSDVKSSSLSQTETHKQTWFIQEDDDQQASVFNIISSNSKVALLGSISDQKDAYHKYFILFSIKETDLANLLGIDASLIDRAGLDQNQSKVITLYLDTDSSKENNLMFKLTEDYYEVRLELKQEVY